MTHSTPRTGGENTQEPPEPGDGSRRSRRERRTGSGPLSDLRSPEALLLLLALLSLIILVPLRGVLSIAPLLLYLATLMLFMIPGFMLSRIVANGYFSGFGRLPLAFALSTGIFGPPAIPFLVLNRSFVEYLLACSGILALALGLALYRTVRSTTAKTTESTNSGTLTDLLWIPFLALTGVLAYVSTVIQEKPNGDSWIYLAYVRNYTSSENLGLNNPILGRQTADAYISFRTMINGWLMEQALLSRVSGIVAVDLVFEYLAPTLVVFSLLAVYALARILLARGPALLIGSLTALFFLVDLQSTIPTAFLSPGNDFVARVTEDKYVARFLFLPIALGLAVIYLRERKLRYVAGFAFVCWSVAVVHPIGVILIGIATAGLGFFHLAVNFRRGDAWKSVLGLAAAVGSISVPPLLYLLVTRSPLLYRASDSRLSESLIENWASSKRLLILGGDSYIMHPALLLNPAMVAAYALLISFVLFRLRTSVAAQLLFGALVFTPLLIYVPPVSTPLAEIIGPWVLVRLSWPIALAAPIVIGWTLWTMLDYVASRTARSSIAFTRYAGFLLPILLMTALLATTSPISLAAVRSADVSDEVSQEQASCFDPLFRWMQSEIEATSTVLAPYAENSCIPAYNDKATVVTLRGLSRDNSSVRDLLTFYSGYVVGAEDIQFLRREGVGYVLLTTDSPLNAQLRHLPGFLELDGPGDRYSLYEVDLSALVETPAVTANTAMNNAAFDDAAGYYDLSLSGDSNERFVAYMGKGLLNSKQDLYANAAANYEEALSMDSAEPTLYSLLSNAYESAGEPDLARLALENGVTKFPDSVQLRRDLSELLMLQDHAAAVEIQRSVVERSPEVPEYRIELGAYLSLNGQTDAADREFERATRINPLSAQIHADVGHAYRMSGREEAAIQHYERALELAPDLEEARENLEAIQAES